MNFRFIEAFYWVATLGSVTRAAEKLSLTQSAASSRISSLEQELDVELFDRRDRQMRLTAAGQRLLVHAQRLLGVQRDIRRDLGMDDHGLPSLRIGAIESIAHTWLTALFTELGGQLRETDLELTVETTPLLQEHLRRGLIDVAILAAPPVGEAIRHRELPPLQLAFVCARAGGPARVRRSLAALAGEQILTFQRGSHPHGAVIDLFRAAGVQLQHLHCVSSVWAMLGLVEQGFGVATLPRPVVAAGVAAGRLALVETDAALPPLPLAVAYRIDPSGETIERVVDRIEAVARRHVPQRRSPRGQPARSSKKSMPR